MKQTCKLLSFVLPVLVAVLFSHSAAAQSITLVGSPASHCLPAQDFTDVAIDTWAYNKSTTIWGVLNCGFGTTGKAMTVFVDYVDATTVDTMSCTAYVYNWNHTQLLWSANKTSGWETVSSGAFVFSVPALSGYGYIMCGMPKAQNSARSGIRGIMYGPI